ncbi:hypothetical protein [Allobranchiibius sp. CTAmp26]|uniref:hypothetical protein n=1 Tax=Allobranchiibius sp. CTAmp26 TaxID=2815214 RepID=UPI001AA126F9|nr:hypothetical protein [Allobranchiibius sp. CTAmp26]MBO1753863.1 hypothetical protein [Allobranchiibius sp. CTAmp26]
MITRTVSGNRPPTGFLITLWVLTVVFLVIAVAALVASWKLRSLSQEQREQGRAAQAGCLLVGGVPAGLFGLFLLYWAVQVT